MSARVMNLPGGSDSAEAASAPEVSVVCPPSGQAAGGASAFWLTVAAGTAPSHLVPDKDRTNGGPDAPDLVTRELEMSNPDLLRLFKQR